MPGHEAIARSAGAVAEEAAEALKKLARSGQLAEETRTARELCGVLRDSLAIERELLAEEKSALLTVRFEGETEKAAK